MCALVGEYACLTLVVPGLQVAQAVLVPFLVDKVCPN